MNINYVFLALLAGILTAVYTSLDNVVLHQFLTPYSYALVGGWVGVIITIILGMLIGKRVEPSFMKLNLLPKRAGKYAFLSGFFGAAMTFFYLLGGQLYDPSVILPLSQLVLVYLVFVDCFFIEKTKPSLVELESIIIIITGAFLITFQGAAMSWRAILYIGFLFNLCLLFYIIFKQKGMRVPGVDAINYRIWMALWVSVFLTIFSTGVSLANGTFAGMITNIKDNLIGLPWVFVSMGFVFLAFVFDLRALKIGKASIVQSIEASNILLGVPIVLACSFIFPGIFGAIDTNVLKWVLKFLGTLLILLGIVVFSLVESVKYILIIFPKIGKFETVMSKLKAVREAGRLSCTADGNIIAEISVKSVGRVSNTINEKIRKIKEIKNIKMFPVLKKLG